MSYETEEQANLLQERKAIDSLSQEYQRNDNEIIKTLDEQVDFELATGSVLDKLEEL